MHHSSFSCLRKPLQKHDHKAITFPLTQQRKLDCCWMFFCSHLKEKEKKTGIGIQKKHSTQSETEYFLRKSSSACSATLSEIRIFKSLMLKEKFNCRILSSFTGNQEKWSNHTIFLLVGIFFLFGIYTKELSN